MSQRERPEGTSIENGSGPAVPSWATRRRRRARRWVVAMVGAVLATVALGLVRLSGEADQVDGSGVAPHMRLTAVVDARGSIEVVQRIAFASPRTRLVVSIPVRPAPSDELAPRIDEMTVRVGGQDEPGLSRALTTGGTRTIRLPRAATSVTLSYSVRGAVRRTEPSAGNRGLALVTPLVVDETEGMASRVEIDQDGVLNLGCSAGNSPMTACGADTGSRWVVGRAADEPPLDVIAQVDLFGSSAA